MGHPFSVVEQQGVCSRGCPCEGERRHEHRGRAGAGPCGAPPPSIAEAEGRRKFSKLSRAATLPDQQLKEPQQEQTPSDQVLWMHRDLPAALLHATAESGSKIPLCRKNQKQAKAVFTTAVIHLEGTEAGIRMGRYLCKLCHAKLPEEVRARIAGKLSLPS